MPPRSADTQPWAAVRAGGGAVLTLPLKQATPGVWISSGTPQRDGDLRRAAACLLHSLTARKTHDEKHSQGWTEMRAAAWWTCGRPAMSRGPPDRRGSGRDMKTVWILTVVALITARTGGGSPLVLEPEVLLSNISWRYFLQTLMDFAD